MTNTRMTNTLLIANRGEIARRVIRSARASGWRTVALHTDLDATAAHVREADQAIRVEGYLDIGAVVAAAREAGASHVHPGYGFLSERAPFARALAEAGITLVGPSAEVMDAMGRKDAAREIAVAAGVPVVPSYSLEDDPETFTYPVLVKAAAGGGGKGMRTVERPEEFAEALAAAEREAASSFGDDTMLIETFVTSGRHIEVQIVGDEHGTVLHFFERDCSTQRRHQKVLEEAPAPTITGAQRAAITAAAVALATKVGYVGAGTVEFLLDNGTGEFYFLEMNTRLQVEHPVTEEAVRIAGEPLDLVALQLRVALGEPLGFEQGAVELVGCAIEARVYAEDSFNGFLPQAGTATAVHWGRGTTPDCAGGVRVDEALESGQEVSTAYDPMLGKVIGYGPDRESARAAVIAALDGTAIFGLTTNAGFLRVLLAGDEFRDTLIDTNWLDQHAVTAPGEEAALALLAAVVRPPAEGGPWTADGFRLSAPPGPLVLDGRELPESEGGRVVPVAAPGVASVSRSGGPDGFVRAALDGHEVVVRGQRFVFAHPDPFADSAAAAGDGTLLAPMPGTVLQVRVIEGDAVVAGDTLGVLEAMKMELPVKAPFDGRVVRVGSGQGDQVALGAVLFVVDRGEH